MTSSHRPAPRRLTSTISSSSALLARQAVDARAIGDVVVDRLRERVRLLEHHADPRAQLHHVERPAVDSLAVELDVARRRGSPSIVSFMRLRQRRKVDLPQPDGPIRAVTSSLADVEIDIEQTACLSP